MITYKQLTLAEIFEDCQNKFDNDKYQLSWTRRVYSNSFIVYYRVIYRRRKHPI